MRNKLSSTICATALCTAALFLTGCAERQTVGQSDVQSSAPLSPNAQSEGSVILSTEPSNTTSATELVASDIAVNITKNTSLYAANRKSIPTFSSEKSEYFCAYTTAKDTAIPLYSIDIYDYARTGDFKIEPILTKNSGEDKKVQKYIANAINEKGEVVGLAGFTVDGKNPGLTSFSPKDKSDVLDFGPDARRINSIMLKRGINPQCKEIKLAQNNKLGYVYYINNGESEYLAAVGMGGLTSFAELFNEENEGLVEIDENFKAFADKKLAELEEYKEQLSELPPGENLVTGFERAPDFVVDNTPFMEDK